MDSVAEHVRNRLQKEGLIQPGDRVVVGVSGGADSVALLHILAGLQADLRLRLWVVHVDHGLRANSSADAAFVERFAQTLQVPVTIIKRDVPGVVAATGCSVEDGARRVRYDALKDMAMREGAARVAVGHTADDQAETVMMRLLRGAGLEGLMAMSAARPLGEVKLIRPLLEVWRRDILGYVAAHQLTFQEDATNQDLRFVRNRIRKHLLPLLERDYNPNIRMLLTQLAQRCSTDTGYLRAAASRQWKRLTRVREGEVAIRLEGLQRQPLALRQQLMRMTIRRVQGDLTGFEFRHWREIEQLLTERPVGSILDLPGKTQLCRERDRVIVRRCEESAAGQRQGRGAPRAQSGRGRGTPGKVARVRAA